MVYCINKKKKNLFRFFCLNNKLYVFRNTHSMYMCIKEVRLKCGPALKQVACASLWHNKWLLYIVVPHSS